MDAYWASLCQHDFEEVQTQQTSSINHKKYRIDANVEYAMSAQIMCILLSSITFIFTNS